MAESNPQIQQNNMRGKVGAAEAARAAHAEMRAMNASRQIPRLPPAFREASDATKVYIYNVGPWTQERLMGSLGRFRIAGCPPEKEYTGPLVIDGVVTEYYPVNELRMDPLMDEGLYVAQQIIGVGAHLHPANSWVPYGVFLSRSNPPTKEELKEALRELWKKYLQLVAEADSAYSRGPKAAEDTIQPEVHFVAARALRKTVTECPWLRNAELPAQRAACPGCGVTYPVGIMKCRDCGYILDKPAYDKAAKEGRFL